MAMTRWNPRQTYTKQEEWIMRRLGRTRKLFAFCEHTGMSCSTTPSRRLVRTVISCGREACGNVSVGDSEGSDGTAARFQKSEFLKARAKPPRILRIAGDSAR